MTAAQRSKIEKIEGTPEMTEPGCATVPPRGSQDIEARKQLEVFRACVLPG